MEYPSREQAAAEILEIGRRMEARGYVVANDGNISCLLGPDRALSTPTEVSKGHMTADMLVETDLEGRVLRAGTRAPSSELRMHLRVYQENPALGAVVHAHPVTATCFAAAGIPLDEPILTETVTAVGSIPVAHFAVPGTQEVPDSVAPFCHAYNGALLANHGVVAWAEHLEQAFFRLEWVEMYAQATLITKHILGRSNWLSCSETAAIMEIRERLGIALGGQPMCAPESSNIRDVLPRSGMVSPRGPDRGAPAFADSVAAKLAENNSFIGAIADAVAARLASGRQAGVPADETVQKD